MTRQTFENNQLVHQATVTSTLKSLQKNVNIKWEKILRSVFLNCALECHARFVTHNDCPYVIKTCLSHNHFWSP